MSKRKVFLGRGCEVGPDITKFMSRVRRRRGDVDVAYEYAEGSMGDVMPLEVPVMVSEGSVCDEVGV